MPLYTEEFYKKSQEDLSTFAPGSIGKFYSFSSITKQPEFSGFNSWGRESISILDLYLFYKSRNGEINDIFGFKATAFSQNNSNNC